MVVKKVRKFKIILILVVILTIFSFYLYNFYQDSRSHDPFYQIVVRDKPRKINYLVNLQTNFFKKYVKEEAELKDYLNYRLGEFKEIGKIYAPKDIKEYDKKSQNLIDKKMSEIFSKNFREYDSNNNSFISVDEFEKFNLKLFKKLDVVNDDIITPEEYTEYLNNSSFYKSLSRRVLQ